MMVIPDEARRTLFSRQQACEVLGSSYIDAAWRERYSDAPKSIGAWPYKPISAQVESNVTQLKRGKK